MDGVEYRIDERKEYEKGREMKREMLRMVATKTRELLSMSLMLYWVSL